MNRSFVELNPVIVSPDFETNKIIAVMMNKLLCGQYPKRMAHRSKSLELHFTDRVARSTYHSYGNATEIKVPFNRDGNHFCNLFINTKDMLFRVQYDIEIFTDCKGDESGLLAHIETNGSYEIVAKSFLRYQDNESEDADIIYSFRTGDHFYSYLKFFEDNINDRVATICKIQNFNNGSSSVNLSIADFFKMCKKGVLEDTKTPTTKAIHSLIEDLIYMSKSGVDRIQAGILRITKTEGKWGTYRIYFGGTIVCNEYSISRFKYMFHPGLQLVAKYLESDRKIETLRHKIEKEMFKRM